jgi:aldose sugar dehydrogenase
MKRRRPRICVRTKGRSGDRFPAWHGNAFLGALSRHLRRLDLQEGRVTRQEALQLTRFPERIRDVRQGPDGLLYVLTDSGALLRIEPAQ